MNPTRRIFVLAAGWIALAAAADAATLPPSFLELRAKDARVSRIGYELATANAPFCSRLTPATGLLLHDLAAYGDGAALKAALGLSGDVAIQAVVPGSPAAKAGLGADMALQSVAGLHVVSMPVDSGKRWERLETIRVTMAKVLTADSAISVQPIGGAMLTIEGVPSCASRFEVGPLGKRAVADGDRIVIGDNFPGHAWADELLAGVMAHELAHNVLAHRAWLDAHGRKQKWIRLTEREADRLAPWLLANAGYDPEAAVRFMQTWGPAHSGGILRKRTHDGWDERLEIMQAEVPLVRAQLATTGRADWRTHFRREALPGL